MIPVGPFQLYELAEPSPHSTPPLAAGQPTSASTVPSFTFKSSLPAVARRNFTKQEVSLCGFQHLPSTGQPLGLQAH